MADNRYGHAISPRGHDAAAKLKSMDQVLRAEILSNARRQYETAARELWLRAHAEAQAEAQAEARAQAQAQLRLQNQVRARPVQTQVQAQGPSRAARYTLAQAQPLSSQTERLPRCSPQPSLPRSAPNAPSILPTTPNNTTNHRFRQVPEQSRRNVDQTADNPYNEDSLDIQELKRRYYAQSSNQANAGYTSSNFHRALQRPSSTIGSNAHMQVYGSTSGQVRTTADEYLDYYMPARRGPHSAPSHQSRQDLPFRQTEERIPHEAHRYEEKCREAPPKAGSRSEVPQTPVQRAASRNEQRHRAPVQEAKESVVPSESSKGKLAFLLNPPQHDSSQTNPGYKQVNTSHCYSSQSEVEGAGQLLRHPTKDCLRPSISNEKYREVSSSGDGGRERPMISGPSSSSHEMDTQRRELRIKTETKDALQDTLNATYNRPTKRKVSPPPYSPVCSETSSESEAPRAKRRAFGRLPAEYDSQSELGPEEEETDEARVAKMSESNKDATTETRTGSRHKTEYSATSKAKISESKDSPTRSTSLHKSEHHPRRSSKSSTGASYILKPVTRARNSGDEKMTPLPKEDKHASSSSSEVEESKKYNFRTRAKPHSR